MSSGCKDVQSTKMLLNALNSELLGARHMAAPTAAFELRKTLRRIQYHWGFYYGESGRLEAMARFLHEVSRCRRCEVAAGPHGHGAGALPGARPQAARSPVHLWLPRAARFFFFCNFPKSQCLSGISILSLPVHRDNRAIVLCRQR